MGTDNSRFAFGTPQAQLDRDGYWSEGAMVGNELTTKTDLEALLPMFGACRMNPSGGTVGTNRFLPFTDQIGTMRGCQLATGSDGGIILNAVGQWQLTTRVQTAATGVIAGYEIRQEVFDPEGVMVDRQYTRQGLSNGDDNSIITSAFIVDRPGYWVRVYSLHAGGVAEFRHTRTEGASYLSAQYVYNGQPRFLEVEE